MAIILSGLDTSVVSDDGPMMIMTIWNTKFSFAKKKGFLSISMQK